MSILAIAPDHPDLPISYNAPVNELKDKAVLITGGARRLGKAIALAMAQAGAQVAITYLTSAGQARQTLSEIKASGGKSLAVPCDTRQEESVRRAVNMVREEFGQLDILVNNAGVYATARFEDISVEQWDNIFTTNVIRRSRNLGSRSGYRQLYTAVLCAVLWRVVRGNRIRVAKSLR